jgi:hypothetical protein
MGETPQLVVLEVRLRRGIRSVDDWGQDLHFQERMKTRMNG